MDQRKAYADPPQVPARRPKNTIEQLEAHPRYAAAAEILRVLRSGMAQVESEIDALNIEGHLITRPSDPRAPDLRNRLKTLRAASGKTERTAAAARTEMPATVTAALTLINDGVRPQRSNRRAAIAQLESDKEVIREAIFEQQPIVDALRDELSLEAAQRHAAAYQKLVVATYRAAQTLAAAADAERNFQVDFAAAGYSWRPDVMKGYALRAALILGSEHDFDSEISRARRFFEEAKILK